MNFSLKLVLFNFLDVQSHGRQASLHLVFIPGKSLGLTCNGSRAMLLSPNSLDSQEPEGVSSTVECA